jgi:D-arabinose 1-dehydrogenase-like Zn-dependent alcohol dehydrogenase
VWCTKAGNLGLSRDGGFEEFALADSRQVAPVPKELQAVETAPLMCAGLTIWNALETGGINLSVGSNNGKTVAIIGAGGGLGHLGVQFAVKLGCNVIAVDTGDKALKLLEEVKQGLGSDGSKVTIVDGRSQDAADVRIQVCGKPDESLEGEKGADCALILPEAQAAFEYGMKLLKNHSVCVTVSFPIDGFKMMPRDLVFRHIQLKGVLVGRNRHLRAMLQFAGANGVRAKITTYNLKDLNQLVDDYHQGAAGKLVVDMSKT